MELNLQLILSLVVSLAGAGLGFAAGVRSQKRNKVIADRLAALQQVIDAAEGMATAVDTFNASIRGVAGIQEAGQIIAYTADQFRRVQPMMASAGKVTPEIARELVISTAAHATMVAKMVADIPLVRDTHSDAARLVAESSGSLSSVSERVVEEYFPSPDRAGGGLASAKGGYTVDEWIKAFPMVLTLLVVGTFLGLIVFNVTNPEYEVPTLLAHSASLVFGYWFGVTTSGTGEGGAG